MSDKRGFFFPNKDCKRWPARRSVMTVWVCGLIWRRGWRVWQQKHDAQIIKKSFWYSLFQIDNYFKQKTIMTGLFTNEKVQNRRVL